ncbi:nucleotidyltransferase family protein [Xanthomonas fragariae]|uniref:nucleotidyltransferase family protein n=1 Tax=Xanthomonas fragariae TaxID=48664 RepID=UPI001ABE3A32|nr:nucleotidyltransferase domain-containing protein [Xanthomonas fragariae]UKR52480.1 nucleotidyltransferase domain-containing protein [Xanthomonas fragariae]
MSDVDAPAPGGVAAAHWQCMGAVFAQWVAVEEVCLYGSRARGTNRPNSDIDLCITSSTLDFIGLARLGEALADLGLPWKIDLTLRRTRTPPVTAQPAFNLAHQIARYAVPVFVRASER